MSIKTHTCVTITCDVCGEPCAPDDYAVHFASAAEARRLARFYGWLVTGDGHVICNEADIAHQTAMDGLLPPEPVTQVPGQIAIDGEGVE
ncbi:hypothetical protein [Streptomyces syringium]|uniref:hypothetical protein n=1 Tax=Streptomyces syringium TaxID=76729 RepID=UPI003AAB9BA4